MATLWQKYAQGQKIIAMGIMPYRPQGLTFNYKPAKQMNIPKMVEKIASNGCNALGIVIRDTDGFLTYESSVTIQVPKKVRKFRKILSVDSHNRKIFFQAPIINDQVQFEEVSIPNPSERDLLGEFLDASLDNNLRFIGSFTLFADDFVGDLRKDWLLKSRSGWSGRVWNEQDKVYNHFICPNQVDYRQYLRELFQELFKLYPKLDGVGFDYVRFCGPRGITEFLQSDLYCYCDRCVNLFQKEYSIDPRMITPHGRHWRKWLDWRDEVIVHLAAELRSIVKKDGADRLVGAFVFPYPSILQYMIAQNWKKLSQYLDFMVPMTYHSFGTGANPFLKAIILFLYKIFLLQKYEIKSSTIFPIVQATEAKPVDLYHALRVLGSGMTPVSVFKYSDMTPNHWKVLKKYAQKFIKREN
ncbi:MAG: putative glycoside hydrolase [Candidatus Helarchaeota archaeon]